MQNGGFTVFGQVFAEDMEILEDMQDLLRCGNNFGSTPMVNFTSEQCTSGAVPGYENFVTVYAVNVVDSNEVTDSDLNKVRNTLIGQQPGNGGGSGGGGSAFWLLLLGAAGLVRKRIK